MISKQKQHQIALLAHRKANNLCEICGNVLHDNNTMICECGCCDLICSDQCGSIFQHPDDETKRLVVCPTCSFRYE